MNECKWCRQRHKSKKAAKLCEKLGHEPNPYLTMVKPVIRGNAESEAYLAQWVDSVSKKKERAP